MNETPFWERLDGESETAYSAFCTYRDTGLTRSLRKAAAAYYSQRQGDQGDAAGSPETEGTSGQVARFKEWSRRWMWVARVEAFDAEEARERSLRLRERRIRMSEHHYAIGQLALQRVAERLRAMTLDEAIPLKSLATLMRAAADLQRLSLGEPTAALDLRGAGRPREEDADDGAWMDDLSLEEMEELALWHERIDRARREGGDSSDQAL